MTARKINPEMAILVPKHYETDFYAWTQEQASLLRNRQWNQLDLSNLIEEIESLGRQQRRELNNRLSILIGHLLKWEYQPQFRSRSWRATIRIQRIETTELIEDNPSLKPYLETALQKAYFKGVALVIRETNLPESTFSQIGSYSLTEILDDRFYPGEPSDSIDF